MAKPLQLRSVRVYPSAAIADRGIVPPELHFRGTTHHVSEMFSLSLPRGLVLDGSSLIQITCGPRGDSPRYLHSGLGTTEVFIDPFDFPRYRAMSPCERERVVLDAIESELVDIARRVGADTVGIHAAASSVREADFSFDREVTKLRKSLPNRQGTVRVCRTLGSSFSEAWVARVVDKHGQVLSEHPMREPAPLDLSGHFFKASIGTNAYLVHDRLGVERFRLSVSSV